MKNASPVPIPAISSAHSCMKTGVVGAHSCIITGAHMGTIFYNLGRVCA